MTCMPQLHCSWIRHRLQDDLHEPVMDAYRVLLRQRFTTKPVFFGFRRILFVASR